ncbi:hypothetical protein [Ramlibacter sp. Leaf400]|uniref:hypothetical protein n=1 Tax=Ramlibacter sp. Leaf400 TaxID=1736365 RepID=UPI0006FE1752|nr:hypothetical protein [Ramlibacter sp. Leaf400]KQT10815.1 hypothetical protein ASG30_08370 [Ramlibacter sp. Leaf400]
MDPLDTLIEQEQAKLRILEAEVAKLKHRVQTLVGMRAGSDIEAFLNAKVTLPTVTLSGTAVPSPTPTPAAPHAERVFNQGSYAIATNVPLLDGGRRKKGEVKRTILALYTLGEARKLSDALQELREKHYPEFDSRRMRSEVWTFKNDGLLESSREGYHKLTDKGLAFISRQEGERPGEAGLSGATESGQDLI